MNIVDSSFGTQGYGWQQTRTAHLLVPRDGKPGRETVIQADIFFTAQSKDCYAKVSILNDVYGWTTLLSLPTGEQIAKSPSSNDTTETIERTMEGLAAELLSRAAAILGS
jgi:hypothetical protein